MLLLSPVGSAHAQGLPARTLMGTLSSSDPLDADGRHHATRAISLDAGDELDVQVAATQFSPRIRIVGPTGFVVENDAAPSTAGQERLRLAATSSGRYVLDVASTTPGATGDFALTLSRRIDPAIAALQRPRELPVPPPSAARVTGATAPNSVAAPPARVVAVLVGLDHYADGASLEYVVDDIRALAAALESRGVARREDITLLGDADATIENVRRALISTVQQLRPSDTLVFFFGGHGGVGSMALYDGGMRAEDLSAILDASPARQLIALDSCHAGSFESVVHRRPNRVGLFSSRANETSYVAPSVRSGGWLDYELIRAFREAPTGRDQTMEISDLARYISRGYRRDVQGVQHLVVARGSRHADLTLWRDPAPAVP